MSTTEPDFCKRRDETNAAHCWHHMTPVSCSRGLIFSNICCFCGKIKEMKFPILAASSNHGPYVDASEIK